MGRWGSRLTHAAASSPPPLRYATLNLGPDADTRDGAVEDVLAKGIRTADLGPAEGGRTVSTGGMGDAIIEALAARA